MHPGGVRGAGHRHRCGQRRHRARRTVLPVGWALYGADVVVQPVAHMQDLPGRTRHGIRDPDEERRVRLGHPPVVRRGDEIGGQPEGTQNPPGTHRLVPRHAHPQPRVPQRAQSRPGIGVKIPLAERFRLAGPSPPLPLRVQVKAWPEHLEGLAVVPSLRDHRAGHRRERPVPGAHDRRAPYPPGDPGGGILHIVCCDHR